MSENLKQHKFPKLNKFNETKGLLSDTFEDKTFWKDFHSEGNSIISHIFI